MANDRNLTCDQLTEALDEYLDGRLGAVPRAALEAHLAQCPACPALVADVRAIRDTARTLEPIEPPDHVWRLVRARVSLEAPPPARWAAWLQPAAAAAGLVLVVGSLTWISLRLTDTPPAVQIADGAGALAGFQLAEA
jgi:anti-sigma factor RsiW